MAVAYHHGVQTERVNGGTVPVSQVDGAIVGLIGTAPIGAVNELKLCQTTTHFAQFGGTEALDAGYTIPDALDIIGRYQAGTVYVVNVLDPAKHRTTVNDEVLSVDADTLTAKTRKGGLLALSVTAGAANAALVEGRHYTANMLTGEIVFITSPENAKATYVYADPAKVTDNDVRGGIDSATGQRTGFELLKTGFSEFGADARILICPKFSESPGMRASLETLAEQLNAIAYVNPAPGTTYARALAGRGPNWDKVDQSENLIDLSKVSNSRIEQVEGGIKITSEKDAGLNLFAALSEPLSVGKYVYSMDVELPEGEMNSFNLSYSGNGSIKHSLKAGVNRISGEFEITEDSNTSYLGMWVKSITVTNFVLVRQSAPTNLYTSSPRVHLFYPHVIGERGNTESLATHAAGLRLATDVNHGYWFSTSNRQLKGVAGSEVKMTCRVNDAQSETNQLNAKGITTVFNSFGTGYRLWGNRLACYPTVTHISNFETVQRTADLIDESIAQAELQFVDQPVDEPLLDSLLGTIETYMGTLKSIVGFEVMLDPDADLVDAFSQGLVPLQYEFTPKIPAERINNKSVVTRKYLVNLVSNKS